MSASRESDFDVTGTVQVSRPNEVCNAVREIFEIIYPGADFTPVSAAFTDFRRLFEGEFPGYRGCDTVYHDMQHSLDVTLAMARLLAGYEQSVPEEERLGQEYGTMGIVAALFHDAGYILRDDESDDINGAEFTTSHVSRGCEFVRSYMPEIGLGEHVETINDVIHFTGYERDLSSIATDVPKVRTLGRLLGTADLVAQMSDRCYLEKCRDRLYTEFVLGGLAVHRERGGETQVQYQSGEDLLKQTPEFYQTISRQRLDGEFKSAYRYFERWFDGKNPYLSSIRKNLEYLEEILRDGDWSRLRRTPPVFTSEEDTLETTQELVAQRLDDIASGGE